MLNFWRFAPWVLLLGFALFACMPEPPPRWVEGGAPLLVPNARWHRGNNEPIVIRADGNVLEGDKVVYFIDRVGRVVDERHEPVALLQPDGSLLGPDSAFMGRVGTQNASPPWSEVAWLRVRTDGKVALYDYDGEVHHGGTWTGCSGAALRACTLVTHVIALRAVRSYQGRIPRIGIGTGMWY